MFTSFGEVTKLLPAPYVFMISPRVVGKNDLVITFGTITLKNIQSHVDLPWFIVHGVYA